ncbi:NADAR family protein [Thermodesulfobacteriota bacterium]
MFYKRDRDDFDFLSNFYPASIILDEITWPSVEHYYQGQKSHNPDYTSKILQKDIASWAKFVGDSRIGNPHIAKKSWFRRHPGDLRTDWDEIKEDVMRRAVSTKFYQNADLREKLRRTWPAKLIEDSKRDPYWGWGEDKSGKNMLGTILMQVRDQIRKS